MKERFNKRTLSFDVNTLLCLNVSTYITRLLHKPILFTSVDFGHPNELCGRGFIDFMYHESSTLTVQK